jgi:hypothetical protein
MAKSALLDLVPASRRQTIWHEEDGRLFIETRQDCEAIVEAARILAETPPDRETGWRFVCAIPEAVLNRAFVEGWFHDQAAWRRWARERDNRAFNGGRENPF